MSTIPRHYPHEQVIAGERQDLCAYCGAKWYRSDLRRDPSGYLTCPDCDDGGRDVVTLDRQSAESGQTKRLMPPPSEER